MKRKKPLFLTAVLLILSLTVFGVNPSLGATTTFVQGSQYDQGTYDLTAVQPTAFNWTRNSTFSAIALNPYVKWKSSVNMPNSPIIGPDGTIYGGSASGYFYAINQDGSIKWSYYLAGNITHNSPVLGKDGTIYTGSTAGTYALNSDGTLKWKLSGSNIYNDANTALSSDGTLYLQSFAYGTITAVDSVTGAFKWSTTPKLPLYSTLYSMNCPAISSDGTIYFATYSGGNNPAYFYAYNPDGTQKWRFQFPANYEGYSGYGSPAISQDGNSIYIGSNTGKLYAFNKDGTITWTYTTDTAANSNNITGAPVVGKDGTIYFGSWNSKFYALNPDGTLKWKFSGTGLFAGSPIIDNNGNIIFCDFQGKVYNLTPDGVVKWSLAVSNSGTASPAIGSDGTIYFGGTNLVAIGGDLEPKPIDFTITIYHKVKDSGEFIVYPGTGETYSKDDLSYVEWLNGVKGFEFVNLWTAANRVNDPADIAIASQYTCVGVEATGGSNLFDLNVSGSGNTTSALVTGKASGHYEITFWYDHN